MGYEDDNVVDLAKAREDLNVQKLEEKEKSGDEATVTHRGDLEDQSTTGPVSNVTDTAVTIGDENISIEDITTVEL